MHPIHLTWCGCICYNLNPSARYPLRCYQSRSLLSRKEVLKRWIMGLQEHMAFKQMNSEKKIRSNCLHCWHLCELSGQTVKQTLSWKQWRCLFRTVEANRFDDVEIELKEENISLFYYRTIIYSIKPCKHYLKLYIRKSIITDNGLG